MDHHVSIIIPTYNRAHFLPECLDALLGQTVPASEIIVVNDGSTDGTPEILAPYINKISYIEKPNGGKASALNLGLAHATGDFIWICDDDDLYLSDALETHLSAFKENPDIDFTYSAYHVAVSDTDTGKLMIIETCEAFRGQSQSLFLSFAFGAAGTGIGFMLQQGMLVRRYCYDTVGPFDESLTASEDLDMNLRLCQSFKGRRVEKATFIVRRHSGIRGPSRDRYSFEERDKKLRETDRIVFRKIYRTIPIVKYLDNTNIEENYDGWQGEALVTRARIMAKWGLDDLVIKDFETFKELISRGKIRLNEKTLDQIFFIESLCHRLHLQMLVRFVQGVIVDLLKLTTKDKKLRRYAARHYYWKGRERFSRGERKELFRGIIKALSVLMRC
jgi:glycosyltransferase involved in cell wall biosynthesis